MTLKTAKRKNLQPFRTAGFLAEKEGFEPSRPFRSLHDFQSCALDQLGDFSISTIHFLISSERYYYNSHFSKVNPLFQKFSLFQQGAKMGEGAPSGAPLLSAVQRRCCPPRDPQRHPVCGCSCPPGSWGSSRAGPSCPLPRRSPSRRPYRARIRYTSSFQSLLFGTVVVWLAWGEKMSFVLCQMLQNALYCCQRKK